MSQFLTGNAASNLVLAIDKMTEMIFGDYYRISVAFDVDCHDDSDPQIAELGLLTCPILSGVGQERSQQDAVVLA